MSMDTQHNVDRLSELLANAEPSDVTIFDSEFQAPKCRFPHVAFLHPSS